MLAEFWQMAKKSLRKVGIFLHLLPSAQPAQGLPEQDSMPPPLLRYPTQPPIIPGTGGQPPVLRIDGIDVYQFGDVIEWVGDLSIDYDGAPNAYGPSDQGLSPLDRLANAGRPGNWWGVETDNQGQPVTQTDGPYKGYYISTTALTWPGRRGQSRYVDSTTIPYLAIPPELKALGVRLGDLALVTAEETGRRAYAIVADIGPRRKLGEGSFRLAQLLEAVAGGARRAGIGVRVFLGSGNGRPMESEEIQARGRDAESARGVA